MADEEFTYAIEVEAQYRDIDSNGHVNQAVYASWFEQARSKYWGEVIGIRHDRAPVALVKQEIEYRRPIGLDESVTIHQRIDPLGETSIPFTYEARVDDDRAATADVVLLSFDREAMEAAPIPEAWREPIEDFEGH